MIINVHVVMHTVAEKYKNEGYKFGNSCGSKHIIKNDNYRNITEIIESGREKETLKESEMGMRKGME